MRDWTKGRETKSVRLKQMSCKVHTQHKSKKIGLEQWAPWKIQQKADRRTKTLEHAKVSNDIRPDKGREVSSNSRAGVKGALVACRFFCTMRHSEFVAKQGGSRNGFSQLQRRRFGQAPRNEKEEIESSSVVGKKMLFGTRGGLATGLFPWGGWNFRGGKWQCDRFRKNNEPARVARCTTY